MYQVLFAEDELLVRLGLQNSIPWERFEMELVAQADNGIEAFELYERQHPDVVITDIRMEGMDGYELIKKIREVDDKCAIIVISCLDDFETLRKMIPKNIIGYILKASMSMDEVFEVLEKARVHLKKIGRNGKMPDKEVRSAEDRLFDYLTKEGNDEPFPGESNIENMLLFFLDEESKEKINSLAMKFVRELVKKQIPDCQLIEAAEKEICLILPEQPEDLDDRIKRICYSANSFLGVKFQVLIGKRNEQETLKAVYNRLLQQRQEAKEEERSWDILIQRAIVYMREHYQQNLSLNEMSKVMNISSSYFSYLFKKETGKNYIEFLNEIRLEKVLEELRTSDHKIAVIAENNGFHNLEYFSRFFKKRMNISPAKWRRLNK